MKTEIKIVEAYSYIWKAMSSEINREESSSWKENRKVVLALKLELACQKTVKYLGMNGFQLGVIPEIDDDP